jgi:hypothetical protein
MTYSLLWCDRRRNGASILVSALNMILAFSIGAFVLINGPSLAARNFRSGGLIGVLGPSVGSPGQWLSTEGMHVPIHIVQREVESEDAYLDHLRVLPGRTRHV